ncbi:putative RING finger membrane protein [Lyophyllum shimeji]|uniref:RING-type E3 ubiquitin transferase n=1 Tax=Lyophyllum shimeji TaxID=47721 RepID=A0A9P3PWQ2_LYOSH|nr:putative RING finger membrane protein [Lyophyllum shimeji]
MQEAEEQDTCRICSAPAEADQPLFHPCKCSGTIRYIHQDCLTTWLSHSKKKNCDVCKHPYSFTKVYASDMPSSLPPVLLIRRLLQQMFYACLFGLRAVVVGTIWLGVLPWATVWTWRMYFSMGESTAWWISGRPRPPSTSENPFYYNIQVDSSSPVPATFLGRLTTHPLWVALSADIFMGQIIASLIVLTFVAVFLLREWISQNARPGVFEDEEVLPEEAPFRVEIPAPAAPPGEQQQPRENNPLDEALARRQIETLRALDALHARDGVNGHMVGDERNHGRSPLDHPRKKNKGRQRRKDRLESELPAFTRRKLLSGGPDDGGDEEPDPEQERLKRRSFSRRVFTARLAGARRKAALNASVRAAQLAGAPPLQVDPKFEFTFKADAGFRAEKASEAAACDSGSSGDTAATPTFPAVVLQPPRGTIPFSFDQVKSGSSSPPPPVEEERQEGPSPSSSTSSLSQGITRRPPLPASSLPPPGAAASNVSLPVQTPVEPSSLATYRAPEQLEPVAGPSRLPDLVATASSDEDAQGSENEEAFTPEEYATYFGDASQQSGTSEGGIPSDRGTHDEAGGEPWRYEYREDAEESENDEEEDEEEDEEDEAAALGDFWEVVDGEGGQELPQPVNPDAGAAPPGQEQGENQPPGIGGVPPELAEELEANVEDDMEGAMEAIGMRGPIYGVLQNAALMIFVLDTAIGLGIWIPFTIGKSTALLSLDPPRFLQILHLPIRAIRLITDPIVDSVAFFVVEFLLPPVRQILLKLAIALTSGALFLVRSMFGQPAANNIANTATKLALNVASLTERPLEDLFAWTTSAPQPAASAESPSFISAQLDKFIVMAEPYFAWLGRRVRLTSVQAQLTWMRLAIGESPADRAFAILLGYAVASIILALYLNLLTIGNARSAGRAIRSAVRQQLLVLKVATFIFIELVTFPLSCGIVLDLCTVWLFPEANLTSRAAFFLQSPLTAIFYHWVAGTLFMYTFAVLLSGCRSVMRPGAMWFIKDPQDQNSHPIRDILDRPTLTQLRKICFSGVLYSKSIMPFRWKNREPLSNVPVDLLFLHLVLPYTMHYFRPKKALKECASVIWKILAKRLRLTSYFFGGRHPDEERSRPWRIFSRSADDDAVKDGTFRRVPATDNLVLPRDMRATAGVTEEGEPVDAEARKLMAEQNAEILKAKRNIKDDFMVVYLPPAFQYRVIAFIASLWVIGAILLGIAVALPILLGRRFFEFFTTRDVHDGYSLIVGFYLLWGFYLIGSAIDRLDKRRQRGGGDRNRAELPFLLAKRGLLWLAKSAYMAICLGIIIPTLISFVIDLYIIIPIRFTIDPAMTPRIRVVDTWALGLLYVKIALHANRIQPPNRISRGIQHIIANGWTNSDPVQATKEVIGPVVGGLLSMILFPGAVFRAVQYLLPNVPLDDKFIFMHVYPGIFMFAGLVRSAIILYDLLSSWSQSIRDKEFLVEMRLRNHEPEKVNVAEGEANSEATSDADQPRADA